MSDYLDLYDYRCRVAAMYRERTRATTAGEDAAVILQRFRDATCPVESYGGGRYLFDTIKGSDFLPAPGTLGRERILLDFNYAYNPSCAYNDRWVCPLAPTENRLNVPIRAGEMNFKQRVLGTIHEALY